jgi:hypothetical protein
VIRARAAGVVAALGIAAASAAAADPLALVERARLELQPPGRPFQLIAVENPLGDVRVEGHDKPSIEIESRKQGPSEAALDRLHISLTPQPDGSVRIATTADGGRELAALRRSAVKLDLVIRAPRAVRVEATSIAGALELANLDNGGDLDTASGQIVVRNVAGAVVTHSVSGLTSLTQVFGAVDAQTLAAAIELDSIGGERLVAAATEGRIAARRVRSRSVELTTVRGSIVLEGELPLHGRMVVASLRGDVAVRVRASGAVAIRARGARVELGRARAAAPAQPDGWVLAHHGPRAAVAHAVVEIQSRVGAVSFAVVE